MLIEVCDATAQSEESLQARFERMRQRRLTKAGAIKNPIKPRGRSEAERDALRARFVDQVKSYLGTPYSQSKCGHADADKAPLYLDCCGLVRRCLLDLKEEFGFTPGPWNQAYQIDTLPIALSGPSEMKPGDLIFWSGKYNNPKRKAFAHDMVHVEVFLGGATGEATIGSRCGDVYPFKGVVAFDSYRTYASNNTSSHSHQLHFRSIDTWLDGQCVSHCKSCSWVTKFEAAFRPRSVFHAADDDAAKPQEAAAPEDDAADDAADDTTARPRGSIGASARASACGFEERCAEAAGGGMAAGAEPLRKQMR